MAHRGFVVVNVLCTYRVVDGINDVTEHTKDANII